MSRLEDNVARVREQIAAAAARSGHPADAVTLVAVTKYVDSQVAGELARVLDFSGNIHLGEARPQELWSKAHSLQALPIQWHLIGHLQRNKIEQTLPLVSLIHSADSLRLIVAIDTAAAVLGQAAPILLEVNISGDQTKHGFKPDEMAANLTQIAKFKHVDVQGLMTMAGREGNLGDARREFSQLRELRDRLSQTAPPNISFRELSMGMSGDFEVAIEEGATIVRVGSALFEGLR